MMRRAWWAVFIMIPAGTSCVPSMTRLVEQRRFADAMCVASNEEEAVVAARAVWLSVEPQAHVHAVTREEWESLLGEARGAEAASHFLALRASWAHNPVSIAKVELELGLWVSRPGGNEEKAMKSARNYEQRRTATQATGERIPPRRSSTVTTSWTPAKPRDPLGAILSLFAPSSSSSTVLLDPDDAEYAKAGPAAYALVDALTAGDNATGFVLGQEDRKGAVLRVSLHLEDTLPGSGRCSLHVHKDLASDVEAPSFASWAARQFGGRYRRVASLPGKTSAWLTNPQGFWRVELDEAGPTRRRTP